YLVPDDIGGTTPTRIHDLEIADMDGDTWEEMLWLSQITSDDTLSTTRLQIYELDDTTYYDNPTTHATYDPEDDLPEGSHINTEDSFGHTIIVEDVDNDGEMETIIVGKDYLKIFGPFMFTESTIPLVIDLTDGTSPNMGGGAAVFDIDDDSDNELIVGHSNGTVFIYEITDSDSDPDFEDLSATLEWKGDLGTSPGKRNSIVGYDIDEDGQTEAIISDNFGQIIVLGKGTAPELTITSPNPGYVSNRPTVLVTWEVSNDTLPMYAYNILVNSMPVGTAGGGQTGFVCPLATGPNLIEVFGMDITGKVTLAVVDVEYIAGAPEVTIHDPENFFMTSNNQVFVNYSAIDPQGDPIDYYIYINGTSQYGPGTDTSKVVTLHIGGTSYDGTYNITVVAVDTNTGDTGRATVFVILDQTIPHVQITSPSDGSAVSASQIFLIWEAFDNTSGIDYFEVWRDTDSLGTTTNQWMFINLTTNKLYTIRVDAYDNLGNSNSSTINLIRDSIKPTITITEPSLPTSSEGWYMTENPLLDIEWTGLDNPGGSGIDYYVIMINSGFYGMYDEFATSDTIDLGLEGMKEVAVYIYDKAGNFDFNYFEVALDTSNPFVNITSPENDYTTSSDTVNIFWDSHDNGSGIKVYMIYIDGIFDVNITDTTIHSYEASIAFNDTTTITVRAVDYFEKYTDDSVDVIQDPESATFNINSPLELYSYSSSSLVNLTWFIKKIDVVEFHVFVDGVFYNSYVNTTDSIIVDLEFLTPIIEGTYPTFNVTILVWDGGAFTFEDHCFITVDMTPPTVSILDPIHDDIITVEDMLVKWSAFDAGSTVSGYDIWLNGDLVGSWDSSTTEQYIDITGYPDGPHNITVMAYDIAGNNNTKEITVNLFPVAPEFITDLPEDLITNDGDFQFTLTITDPRLGVEEIEVVADSAEVVFSIDYNGSTQMDPFFLLIDVEEVDFVSAGAHNLTVTVYDSYGRARDLVIDVILDFVDPTIFGFIIIDEGVLGSSNDVTIYTEAGTNNHNITITTRDTNGIASVQLNILGTGVDVLLPMTLDLTQSIDDLYVYIITMNLDSYAEGDYTLRFVINDNAGNEITDSYGMSLTLFIPPTTNPTAGPTGGPLDMQTIIIIASSAGGLILIILLSVIISAATKKKRMNRNWEKDMHAVAYVTKTGLTLAYVPYNRDLFEDEQLFGGAMTGIMSILGEITGETDVEMKVNIIEFGDKQLVVCPGFFGNAIILVNDVKPIMKDLVVRFVVDFELTY
ncbi:MAG: Ig-like domain-containing protein, partial [Candidatus Heimdallarchaeota archaeon]